VKPERFGGIHRRANVRRLLVRFGEDEGFMRLLSMLVVLAVLLFAGVHFYFYWATGTFDPCKAAVLRIVQKQRESGQELAAGVGVLFGRQLEDALRSEGVMTCYRSALRGEAPEIELQFLKH
jgi:hypothetical protein